MSNLPLVSVAVVTYKSAQTVVETLNSIKSQTYWNLELIISDDCSPDETISVCKDWLSINKSRFVRTRLIEFSTNTGVAANGNRALDACLGVWVKGIAGDDLLKPNCIEEFLAYASENEDANFMFSRVEAFGSEEGILNYYKGVFKYQKLLLSSTKLLKELSYGNFLPAPSFFYNRIAMEKLGVRNDERVTMVEDWPKWINILKAGGHFTFLDKNLVMYRVGGNGIASGGKPSMAYTRSMALIYAYYQFPIRFRNEPGFALVKRMLYSRYIADSGLFWRFLRGIYEIRCKIRGLEPEYKY